MHAIRIVLVVGIAIGCNAAVDGRPTAAGDPIEIAIERGLWSGLAWSSGSGLVITSDGHDLPDGRQLWEPVLQRIGPALGSAEAIDLPESDCGALRSLRLAVVPPGDVAVADICWDPALAVGGYDTRFLVLGADGAFQAVADMTGDWAPVTFAWNERFGPVVYEVDGSLCRTLYTYTAEAGIEPLNGTAEIDGQVVNLGENVDANPDRCTRTGRAGGPAYAPSGGSLALLASPSHGRTGQDRIDVPWGLVVLSRDGMASTILEGLVDPLGVAWISDDELLIAATLNGRRGVWRMAVSGRDAVLVASQALGSIGVSPDGRRFAGFPECAPPACVSLERSRLLIFELAPPIAE